MKYSKVWLLMSLFLTELGSLPVASASFPVASGCINLLNSSDPEKDGQLYDRRNYYSHKLRWGYTLKEEQAKEAVWNYYKGFYWIEKLNSPQSVEITPEPFCKRHLESLHSLVKKSSSLGMITREVYRGNERLDCHKLLSDLCEAPQEFDILKEPPHREKAGVRHQAQKVAVELVQTEWRYQQTLLQFLKLRPYLLQAVSSIDGTRNLQGVLDRALVDLENLYFETARETSFLNEIWGLPQEEYLFQVSRFAPFLDHATPFLVAYKKSYDEYRKLRAGKYADLNWDQKVLLELDKILITPIQRFPRYGIMLGEMSSEKQFPEELSRNLLEEIKFTLAKAKELNQRLNDN